MWVTLTRPAVLAGMSETEPRMVREIATAMGITNKVNAAAVGGILIQMQTQMMHGYRSKKVGYALRGPLPVRNATSPSRPRRHLNRDTKHPPMFVMAFARISTFLGLRSRC